MKDNRRLTQLFLNSVNFAPRDAGMIKRQRGANAHQRGTSIDPGEDINLQ